MNVVASYLLLKLAGKDPKAADISALIASAGGEADEAKVELLMKEMEGKDVEELLKEGKDKLKSVSMGGGGGGAAAPAAAAAGAAAPAAPVKVRSCRGWAVLREGVRSKYSRIDEPKALGSAWFNYALSWRGCLGHGRPLITLRRLLVLM